MNSTDCVIHFVACPYYGILGFSLRSYHRFREVLPKFSLGASNLPSKTLCFRPKYAIFDVFVTDQKLLVCGYFWSIKLEQALDRQCRRGFHLWNIWHTPNIGTMSAILITDKKGSCMRTHLIPGFCIPTTEKKCTGVPSETNSNLISYHKLLSPESPLYPVFTLWYELSWTTRQRTYNRQYSDRPILALKTTFL